MNQIITVVNSCTQSPKIMIIITDIILTCINNELKHSLIKSASMCAKWKYMQARFGRRMNSMWYKHTLSSAADTHDSRWMWCSEWAPSHYPQTHTVLPADLQHPWGNAARLTQKTNECLIPRSIVRTSVQSGWEDEKRARRALQDADHRNERWEMKCRTMAVSQNLMTFLPRQHFRA